MPILILAGTFEIAKMCARTHKLTQNDWVYFANRSTLTMRERGNVVWVTDGAGSRDDYRELAEVMCSREAVLVEMRATPKPLEERRSTYPSQLVSCVFCRFVNHTQSLFCRGCGCLTHQGMTKPCVTKKKTCRKRKKSTVLTSGHWLTAGPHPTPFPWNLKS